MWTIIKSSEFDKSLQRFAKKWHQETINALTNVQVLLDALNDGVKPEQLKKFGFVHSEPKGIIAVDQKGPSKKTKMKALRIYLYAEHEAEELHVILVGDKSAQQRDIRLTTNYVAHLTPPGETDATER